MPGIYYDFDGTPGLSGFGGEPGLAVFEGTLVLPGVAAAGFTPAAGLDGTVALAVFAGDVAELFSVLAQAAARAAFSVGGGGWHEAGSGLAFCRSFLALCASSLALRGTSSALRELSLVRCEFSLARCVFDFSSACQASWRVLSLTDPLVSVGATLAAAEGASVAGAASPFFAENLVRGAGNAAATEIAGE
jgi:hypothetical protein